MILFKLQNKNYTDSELTVAPDYQNLFVEINGIKTLFLLARKANVTEKYYTRIRKKKS